MFSMCSPFHRSGPVCRAMLAAPRDGRAKAGLWGKSGLAAQHWLGRSSGCHTLQDGFPRGGEVSRKLPMICYQFTWIPLIQQGAFSLLILKNNLLRQVLKEIFNSYISLVSVFFFFLQVPRRCSSHQLRQRSGRV